MKSWGLVAVLCTTLAAAAPKTAWVWKDDGAKSCEPESAQKLEAGARELKASGVKVLASRKRLNTEPRAMVCGQPQGNRNAYRISSADVHRALELGFHQDP